MASSPVLYLGDTSLSGAAGYLAGLMTHFGIGFDYVASDERIPDALVRAPRKLFIFSDYPAKLVDDTTQKAFLQQVAGNGTGLLMIGGWESFCGHGGNWSNTSVGTALPVEISTTDDRVNCDQASLFVKSGVEHPILGSLPWDDRPPTVGGFNRVKPKPACTTLLEVQRFAVQHLEDRFVFERVQPRDPMLVVGALGKGRTAALATDLAPHWVGGFVDWGPKRVTATAPGSWQIEVGSDYAQFVRNLITWTGALE